MHMPVMIQVRNVPEVVHRKLKARAAMAGMSLSDYVLAELKRSLDRPTKDEILARLASREPVRPAESVAAALRAEREGR
jgi:plasmid stability protein